MRQGPSELPPCDLDSVEQVLQAIEVMANGWLLLGTPEIKSIDPRKSMVREFDINDASSWTRFVRKMARSARASGDNEASIVRYLRVREHQTRTVAAKYWKDDGYAWGEAITKALSVDMAVLWTVTGHTNAFGVQVSIPGITDVKMPAMKRPLPSSPGSTSPPTRRARGAESLDQRQPSSSMSLIPHEWRNLANKDLQQHMFCPDFQKGMCTAVTPAQCPRGALHRCDRRVGHGFCGATQHGRKDCHRTPGTDSGKGKGKGKGKAKDRSGR